MQYVLYKPGEPLFRTDLFHAADRKIAAGWVFWSDAEDQEMEERPVHGEIDRDFILKDSNLVDECTPPKKKMGRPPKSKE